MDDREKYCNLDLIVFKEIKKFKDYYFCEEEYTEEDTYDKYSFVRILFNYYQKSHTNERRSILCLLDNLFMNGNKPMRDLILLGFLEYAYDDEVIYKEIFFSENIGLVEGLKDIKGFNAEFNLY